MWGELGGCVTSGLEGTRALEPWRRICLYRRFRAEHVSSASEPERVSLRNTRGNTVNAILPRCAPRGCQSSAGAPHSHPWYIWSPSPFTWLNLITSQWLHVDWGAMATYPEKTDSSLQWAAKFLAMIRHGRQLGLVVVRRMTQDHKSVMPSK